MRNSLLSLLVVASIGASSVAMAADLTAAGKKGISINSSYDFWTPARHYQSFHGGLRILSESASARVTSARSALMMAT